MVWAQLNECIACLINSQENSIWPLTRKITCYCFLMHKEVLNALPFCVILLINIAKCENLYCHIYRITGTKAKTYIVWSLRWQLNSTLNWPRSMVLALSNSHLGSCVIALSQLVQLLVLPIWINCKRILTHSLQPHGHCHQMFWKV